MAIADTPHRGSAGRGNVGRPYGTNPTVHPPTRRLRRRNADVLSDAFDKAIASLQDHGQRPIVRETMAIRILDLAAKGERDPDRLYRAALGSLGTRL